MYEIYNASFVKPATDMGTCATVFQKSFNAENVKKATLEITSKGVYCAYLGGKRIGKYVLAPGWTEYFSRLQFQTYDITDMLKEENLLQIGVGLGWYFHKNYNANHSDVAICAAIVLEKNDGSVEKIYTDSSWEYCKGRTLYDSMYNGEIYDANLEITVIGNAEECECPTGELVPQQGEEIIEQERLPALEIIKTPLGETVIDFGQNLTGYVEFKVKGNKGEEPTITHAEVLDKDGNFYIENMRSAKNEIKFICDGNEHTFKPHYTFQGFRYIKLENFSDEICLDNFTAIVVHSDLKRIGNFRCSSEMLNKLYHNIVWGQKGNFLDIPTDCPQRDERLGWTGDAQVFVRTATYNYDVEKFFTKWLTDMSYSQASDGRIPHVVPRMEWWDDDNTKSSAAWADAAVICPWQIYLTYGNPEILERQYDCMEKWIGYIRSVSVDNLWLGGNHFGDWLGLDSKEGEVKGSTDEDLIASAYYAYSTSLFIKAGKVLGKDMSEYEELLEAVKKAYKEKYISSDGKVVCNTQTACAITLYFDLCDDSAVVAKQLVDLIEKFGHMTTGFVGTPYILHALSRNGYAKVAYDLLLREEYPSWLFSVTMGATTIWEHWDGMRPDGSMWSKEMNSFNHYAYGAVYDWMFGVMAGVDTDENNPAFKHFTIKPITDERIDFVEASIETRYGHLSSAWKRDGDNIVYEFVVPENTTASFCIGDTVTAYGAGRHSVVCPEVK